MYRSAEELLVRENSSEKKTGVAITRRPICITGVGTVARPDAQSKLSREPLLIRLTQKPLNQQT